MILTAMLILNIQVREQGKSINANVDSISMGGISAGGQITAVCQQLARKEGYELKLGMCHSS
jgi:acetyl esterase/lipase